MKAKTIRGLQVYWRYSLEFRPDLVDRGATEPYAGIVGEKPIYPVLSPEKSLIGCCFQVGTSPNLASRGKS